MIYFHLFLFCSLCGHIPLSGICHGNHTYVFLKYKKDYYCIDTLPSNNCPAYIRQFKQIDELIIHMLHKALMSIKTQIDANIWVKGNDNRHLYFTHYLIDTPPVASNKTPSQDITEEFQSIIEEYIVGCALKDHV